MEGKRILLVDSQLFQSFALHRGVGKYSFSLLKELEKKADFYDKKVLIFSNSGIDKKDLSSIKQIAKSFDVEFLHLAKADISHAKNYKAIEHTNKATLDSFIKQNFSGCRIDFLILSLFQQEECPTFPTVQVRKCLLVYDLIPLLFPDLYLSNQDIAHSYLSRFKTLYDADHFYTISRAVANDLSIFLGISKDRITPIYGAPIDRKKIKPVRVKNVGDHKFILLPSGDDPRKNNLKAVLAFEAFNQKNDNQYKLVITSFFDERTKVRLSLVSDNTLFTGHVSEHQLAWLYKNASLVLFPTLYEGLGMPAMEAVEFDKPVVCSDIEVFREIGKSVFIFCDPYSVASIENAISKSFSSELKVDHKAYSQLLESYSWCKTGETLTNSLKKLPDYLVPNKKQKIAIFAPSPSGYSAIGKFVQEQHFELSKLANVDYYLETGFSEKAQQSKIRENLLPYVAECKNPWELNDAQKKQYDKVIYHIGNSEYHVATLIKALSFPSTIVLHDPDISGLYEVACNLGILPRQRQKAEDHINSLVKPRKSKFITSLLSKQQEIIVHSGNGYKAAAESLPKKLENRPSIVRLYLTTALPFHIEERAIGNNINIVIAGLVHEAKGPEIVADIAKINMPGKKINITIIGFSLLSTETEAKLAEISNLEIINAPSDLVFQNAIKSGDIIMNYRNSYQGEPSLASLESMRQGKAVIVNKEGWFDEVPDRLVYKAKNKSEAVRIISEIMQETQTKLVHERFQYIGENHNIKNYIAKLLSKSS